jgi:26S proteasome regulatory subunit N13
MDANTIIQNFIKSMPGGQSGSQESLFTTLADLLTPASTMPFIESADTATVDRLLEYLPLSLVSLAQEADEVVSTTTQDSTPIETSLQAIKLEQKRDILRRVLRSPQFTQSLTSLTIALRDGGLPSLSEALNIPVRNGGFMRRGGVPLGGGDAVEAFLDGVKEHVEKYASMEKNDMDTT